MESPPTFPKSIPSRPVLTELARAIRFFLRTDRKLSPGTKKVEFDWQCHDFPAELRLGDGYGLRKRLNQKLNGDPEHWLAWRSKNSDPLIPLLEIAFIMGRAQGLREVFNCPHALTHVPNDAKRRLADRLMASTEPAAAVEERPELGSC